MGLFKPAWQSKNGLKAIKAAERLTNQQTLELIVSTAQDSLVRAVAVKKLANQAIIAKVAINDSDSYVRACALERITDQATLASIAIHDKDDSVRKKALNRIIDQTILADLVNKVGPTKQEGIVDKLTNQDILADIAENNKSSDIRMMAAKKLTNEDLAQEVYADIVDNESITDVRLKALRKIKDEKLKQKMYVDFAMWGEKDVIYKISDVSILKIVWEKWKKPSKWKQQGGYSGQLFVNKLARRLIESYDDQSLLLEIAQYAPTKACINTWEKLKRLGYKVSQCEVHDFVGGFYTGQHVSGTVEHWTEHFVCRKCGETKSVSDYRYTDGY